MSEPQVILARFALGENVWAVSHALSNNKSFTVSIVEPAAAEAEPVIVNKTQQYLRDEAQRMSEAPKRCLCECGCEQAGVRSTKAAEATAESTGGSS